MTTSTQSTLGPNEAPAEERGEDRPDDVNVHRSERKASAAIGTALLVFGGLRRGLVGVAFGLLGAALVKRGSSGHCPLYATLRLSTAHGRRGPAASVPHGQGVRVRRSVTVRQSPSRTYQCWRALENVPIFMHGVESVTELGEGRSHWRVRGPFGTSLEWESQIINDVEDERIAWRSLPGSHIHHAGSIRFQPALSGQGTLITVTMEYDPPAGLFGALAARLLRMDPARRLEEDLRRFKALMESVELNVNAASPDGDQDEAREAEPGVH